MVKYMDVQYVSSEDAPLYVHREPTDIMITKIVAGKHRECPHPWYKLI